MAENDATIGEGFDPMTGLSEAEESESILEAEHRTFLVQYRELHNRLEDYTVWLIEEGYLAKKAIGEPMPGERSSAGEYMFEMIEAYLDQANEHEDRGPLDQILHPDMSEFTGEPDEPARETPPWESYGSTDADPGA